MQPRLHRQIDYLAEWIGADSWILVRERRHVVVDFIFAEGSVRQTFSSTPGDVRAAVNARAFAARQVRRAVA